MFRQRIDSFNNLEKGWDTYDALPVTKTAIQTAHEILEELIPYNIDRILPTPSGGIVFVLTGEGRKYGNVEIEEDGEYYIFLVGYTNHTLFEYNKENLAYMQAWLNSVSMIPE